MSRAITDDATLRKFGGKLRLLRLRQRLTLKELAQKLGYSAHGYLSEIESGKKKPTVDFVLKIADYFHISTDQLLRDRVPLRKKRHGS
jgi:transcriptional regulator with XRE-family HTH domain